MGLEKINELKKAKGLTNKKISEMTGISVSSLDKITAGDNINPKFGTIKLICDALGCTLDDLADNRRPIIQQMSYSPPEETMIKKYRALDGHGKKIVNLVLDEEYARCTEPDEDEQPTIKIKHSYYKVSAGRGFLLGDGDDWCDDEIEVPDTPDARKADYALTIQGNSMEPVYYDGDIILVKEQNDVDIGQIGIFRLNGEGYIKKNGGDRLISLNNEYNDILIKEYDDCHCVGKILSRV